MNGEGACLKELLSRRWLAPWWRPGFSGLRLAGPPSAHRRLRASKRIATTANLSAGGNGVTGAAEGIPFPIPKQGVEIFWNHVLRFRAEALQRTYGQAPVTAGGSYTLVKLKEDTLIQYSLPGMTEA